MTEQTEMCIVEWNKKEKCKNLDYCKIVLSLRNVSEFLFVHNSEPIPK